MAVTSRLPPIRYAAYRLAEAITTPTRFDDTDRTQPAIPPPTKKNDAQARNTTQMGTVMTSAVSATARPPRTPMLSVDAVRESMAHLLAGNSCRVKSDSAQ